MGKVTRLTNTKVKQAKPKEKVYKLSDVEGLHLLHANFGTTLWEIVPINKIRGLNKTQKVHVLYHSTKIAGQF